MDRVKHPSLEGLEGRQWVVYHDEAPWTCVGLYATMAEAMDESIRLNFGGADEMDHEEPEVLYWIAPRREYYEQVLKLRPPEDVLR